MTMTLSSQNTVFFIEGIRELPSKTRKILIPPKFHSKLADSGAFYLLGLANKNDMQIFDPIRGFLDVDLLFNYIMTYDFNKDEKVKSYEQLFKVTVLKIAYEEIIEKIKQFQPHLLSSGSEKLLESIYTNQEAIGHYRSLRLDGIKKLYFKLKDEGAVSHNLLSKLLKSSLDKLRVDYIKEYLNSNDDMVYEDHGLVSQYTNIIVFNNMVISQTSKLGDYSNQESRNEIVNYLQQHPEINEVIMLCGASHAKFVLSGELLDLSFYQKPHNFEPIHTSFSVPQDEKRIVDFHIFPEVHYLGGPVEQVKKFAKKHNLKLPTTKVIEQAYKEFIEGQYKKVADLESFYTKSEVITLMCLESKEELAKDFLQLKQSNCEQFFSTLMAKQDKSLEVICDKESQYSALSWFPDFDIYVCDNQPHYNLCADGYNNFNENL